ncbi:MAG: TIR domain-containing protein [Planctomycetes bacterium]|nr:TIR domain-containing protein [Planctomycetota bacterium]
MTPLLVHLVFHPDSTDARELAVAIHRALHDDPALPGLRVPTVVLPEDGTGLPPARHDLDEAEHSLVVVFADSDMVLEPAEVPPGRQAWPAFVGDLAERCRDGRHQFLPIQLSESAWPLDRRLEGTSFVKAHAQPWGQRTAWTERRVVIALCRFLMGLEQGPRVPLKVFVSHTKLDIDKKPRVFNAVVEHLNATQPVEAWVDSARIDGGSEFAEEISRGVRDSALLVLATTRYGGRPWCRREVLLAKEHQRPFVVVDALAGLDTRSFPYLGNAPVLSYRNAGAQRAIDLLLKETLRFLHVSKVLAGQKRPEDLVFSSPPELASLVRLPPQSSVLYPDPPLGDEELEVLGPLGHRVETPLQRAGKDKKLSQWTVAVSVSESDDPERYGVLREHLDSALLEVSRHLLVRGAGLAYGGHLGSEGYTVALCDLIRAHQSLSTLPPVERIRNYVGWPLPYDTLPKEKRAKLQNLATFIRTQRPPGVEALEPGTFVAEPVFFAATSPVRRYAWARGMTAMRERQVAEVHARVVIGGKVGPTMTARPDGGREKAWYSGRIPGVLEEALLTVRAARPLYVCGAFGGACAVLVELLEGRPRQEFTWDYQKQAPHAEEMRRIYEQQGVAWWDYPDMTAFLRETGVEGLSRANGLSVAENLELFRTRDLDRIVELLLLGMSRVWESTPPPAAR